MNMNCILITEENREDFASVFPMSIELTDKRVAIAACDDDGLVLGAVSYKVLNFQYEIDWIYVEEEVRRQGVGTWLIEQILRAVMQTGELLPVTARFEFSEEDNEMHSFFLSNEYMDVEYSHEKYYLTAKEIKRITNIMPPSNPSIKVENFFDKQPRQQFRALDLFRMDQTYSIDDYDSWKAECIPDLCKCVYFHDDLADLMFVKELSDGVLELTYLYGKEPKGLASLLYEVLSEKERLYPDAAVTFEAVSPDAEQLAEHMFPGASTVHVYEAEF